MSAFRKFTGESAILKMRSRINRITAMSLVSPFLEHGVYAKFEKKSLPIVKDCIPKLKITSMRDLISYDGSTDSWPINHVYRKSNSV